MTNFFTLVKVQFLSYFGINKMMHSKKKKMFSGVVGLVFFALLVLLAFGVMATTYSKMFAELLDMTGEIKALLPIMMTLCVFISFVFSFYTAGNVIYGFKDYDMLMAMPVSTHTIVLSKLFFTYVGDLMFTVLIMIPSAFVYADYVPTVTASEWIRLSIMVIFSPFLPMAISLFIGAFFAFISSRFRKKNLVQLILYLMLFVVCFSVGFLTGSGEIIDIIASFKKIYFLLPFAVEGMQSFGQVVIYSAINIGVFVIVAVVVCVTYKKMNSLLSARKTNRNFRLKTYGGASQFKALYKRETKRFFSNATYTINSLMGLIMGGIMLIGIAVLFRALEVGYSEQFMVFAPIICAFCFMLAPSTNCAISLEGGAFWIMRSAPVSMNKIFDVKLAVGLTYTALPAFIYALISSIIFGAPVPMVVLFTLVSTLIGVLGAVLGLFFNILFPMMKWENESKPVKQSIATFFSILSALIYSAILFLIANYIPLPPVMLFLLMAAVTLGVETLIYAFITKKGETVLTRKIDG